MPIPKLHCLEPHHILGIKVSMYVKKKKNPIHSELMILCLMTTIAILLYIKYVEQQVGWRQAGGGWATPDTVQSLATCAMQ